MGNFYNPPPPFVGGAQPLAPHTLAPANEGPEVDNPPFQHSARRAAGLAIALAAWQPADLLPTLPGHVPQASAAASVSQPFSNAAVLATISAMWQMADAPPTLPRLLPAQLTAVRVDNPPLVGVLPAIQAAEMSWLWQAGDPALPFTAKLVQGAVVGSIIPWVNPAPIEATLLAWQSPAPSPQTKGPLPPAITAVPVNNPPTIDGVSAQALALVIASWQAGDVPPTLPSKLAQAGAALAANLPYGQAIQLVAVLPTWQAPYSQPQQRGALSPGIPGQSIDPPPLLRQVAQISISDTTLPVLARYIVQTQATQQPGANPSIPPSSWWAADATPILPRALDPQILAVRADAPPISLRSTPCAVMLSWEPTPPMPEIPNMAAPMSSNRPTAVTTVIFGHGFFTYSLPAAELNQIIADSTTPFFLIPLLDENGNPVVASQLNSLTLTIIDSSTQAIINGCQDQSILNTGRGTLDSNGNLTIGLLVADTALEVSTHILEYRSLIINCGFNNGLVSRVRRDFRILALGAA